MVRILKIINLKFYKSYIKKIVSFSFYFLSLWNFVPLSQLVNHGMSIEYLDEVRNVGKQFFSLPEEEKEKYSRTATDPEGYGTDSISSDNVPLKWQFRLFLAVYPLEARKVHRWPQSPQSFRYVYGLIIYRWQ